MAGNADSVDIVIRGGTVVDGTGALPFVGDVAVKNGLITAVGPGLSVRGKEEYDATGLVVAPGWIDPHTHFDAQVTWDPYLTPSTGNGVTTVIMGNCGIGFAPCQPERREFLTHLVEAVEDLPGVVLTQGMTWDWETYEEYLDSIARRNLACDVGVMIGHSAVRTWVMGKRASAADRPNGPTADPVKPHEIEAMAALVQDAVAAGALGFSSSRLLLHRDKGGTLIPGTLASKQELLALASAVASAGGGIIQWAPDWVAYDDIPYSRIDPKRAVEFQAQEIDWMTDIARQHGSKVKLTWTWGWPNNEQAAKAVYDVNMKFLTRMHEAGGFARPQVFARPQGFLWAIGGRLHPFVVSQTFGKLAHELSHEDLLRRMREPDVRAQILAEVQALQSHPKLTEFFNVLQPWETVYPWTPSYEPEQESSIAHQAKSSGESPFRVVYDYLVDGNVLWKPFAAWTGDLSLQHKLFQHPHVIPGADDAGAHGTIFQDASAPTNMITHWARDRTRGPKLSLETVVKKHTADIAELWNLSDRGVLAEGKKADINVMDMDKLAICKPYFANDLPLGAGRWLQQVEGYRLTLVTGRVTYRDGVATGELPGHLVRNPNRDASAWRGIAAEVAGSFESGLDLPDDHDSKERALEGAGRGGTSAVARVLRDTVEDEPVEPVAPKAKL